MRLYRNLVAAAATALLAIFETNQLADRAVPQLLRSNKQWGSKDRRFLASTIYDVVRWYRLYYEILGQKPNTELDWWRMIGIHWTLQGVDLPDWEAFWEWDATAIQQRYQDLQATRAIRASIPDWLDALGAEELGEAWTACLAASNEPAPLVLRVNTLRTTPAQVLQALQKANIQAESLAHTPTALLLPDRPKVTPLKGFRQGHYEVQDAASQQVAPFLEVAPGHTVVDACAGAGGKTLHLAALMHNQGHLTALDIHARKLQELQQRAKRAGVTCVRTQVLGDYAEAEALYDSADRVLLDAPCSGLGTLRRSPQIKWRLTPAFLDEIVATQQQILQHYAPICKVGGQLAYATCSILPRENQVQVQAFLKTLVGRQFEFIREQTLLPQAGFDGFYMALLKRVK